MFNNEFKDFEFNIKELANSIITEVFGDEFQSTEKAPRYFNKNENGYLSIAIPMPGIAKENIRVYFEGGLMVVEGKATTWYTTLEYKNKFRLIDCDENSIKAEFKNGVLELTIKKTEQKKTIKIE